MADPKTATQSAPNTPAAKNGKGRGKRLSREQRGLPPLTAKERMTKQIIQNAENACKLIKQQVENGEPVPAELLQACGVLSGAMSSILGA